MTAPLSEEKVAALTEALHRARVEDGSPAPLLPDKTDRRHVAYILAPLVAGWLAEADADARISEMQGKADSLTGQMIVAQAKAEALREAADDARFMPADPEKAARWLRNRADREAATESDPR